MSATNFNPNCATCGHAIGHHDAHRCWFYECKCHGFTSIVDPNAPQPPPIANEHPAVWDLVVADMRARDESGLVKYGTRLQPHNGRDVIAGN
jgi:hypothetical protein